MFQLLGHRRGFAPGLHWGLPFPNPLTWRTTFKNVPLRLHPLQKTAEKNQNISHGRSTAAEHKHAGLPAWWAIDLYYL